MSDETKDLTAHVYRATYHESNDGWWEMKREEVRYIVVFANGWWCAYYPYTFHNGRAMIAPMEYPGFDGGHVGGVIGTSEHLALTLQERDDAKAWELFHAFLEAEETKANERAFVAKVKRLNFQDVKPEN